MHTFFFWLSFIQLDRIMVSNKKSFACTNLSNFDASDFVFHSVWNSLYSSGTLFVLVAQLKHADWIVVHFSLRTSFSSGKFCKMAFEPVELTTFVCITYSIRLSGWSHWRVGYWYCRYDEATNSGYAIVIYGNSILHFCSASAFAGFSLFQEFFWKEYRHVFLLAERGCTADRKRDLFQLISNLFQVFFAYVLPTCELVHQHASQIFENYVDYIHRIVMSSKTLRYSRCYSSKWNNISSFFPCLLSFVLKTWLLLVFLSARFSSTSSSIELTETKTVISIVSLPQPHILKELSRSLWKLPKAATSMSNFHIAPPYFYS